MKEILAAVARLRRRAFVVQALGLLALSVLGVAAAGLVGWNVARIFRVDLPLVPVAAACATAAAGIGLALAWWRIPTPLGVALTADVRLRLGERLSSALRAVADPSPMAPAVVADAAAHASRVRGADIFPLREPRGLRILAVCAALAGGACFLPLDDALGLEEARTKQTEEKRALNAAAQTLEKKAKEIKRWQRPEAPEKAQTLDHLLEQVANEIRDQAPDRRGAMVKLAALGDKLREERAQQAESLEKVSESVAGVLGVKMATEVKQALEKMDPGAAREAMAKLAEQVKSGAFTPDQMKQLSRELKKMALKLPDDAPLKQSMDKMAEAIAQKAEAQEAKEGEGKEGEPKDPKGQQGQPGQEGQDGEKSEAELDAEMAEALAQMLRDMEGLDILAQDVQAMDEAMDALQQARYGMLPTTYRLCDLCRRGIPHENMGGG